MANRKEPVGAPPPPGPEITIVQNTTSVPQNTIAANNSLRITGIRRGPGGKAAWLVSLSGVCVGVHMVFTDVPVSERRLRSARRFCNVVWYRFGARFYPMPQSDWLTMVGAAIAAGGTP